MLRFAVFALITLDFLAVTAWAFAEGGDPATVWAWVTANPWGAQVGLDLLISMSVGVVWMWRDARAKGFNPLPYALLTPILGSVGLLVYLTRRSAADLRGARSTEAIEPSARARVPART